MLVAGIEKIIEVLDVAEAVRAGIHRRTGSPIFRETARKKGNERGSS
jgi:hypothetical protein